MIRILTVLGARPQFIKAAAVSRAINDRNNIEEIIVHTGQHFDSNMSDVFFEQLDIPSPHHNLHIAGLGHGAMTGRMLEGIEKLVREELPDWVLVYGDTNSTLAGALAAAKLHIPVAHVEAGLRSHNVSMPEEINRVLADRLSSLLLCPTETAVKNLNKESFPFPTLRSRSYRIATGKPLNDETPVAAQHQRIVNTGDVMFDAVRHYEARVKAEIDLDIFGVQHRDYALCTIHRQENTDDPKRLSSILTALRKIAALQPVVLPLHPRTRAKLAQRSNALDGLTVLDPLPYLEMQRLQMSASVILTDSGGIQKESFFHGVPCITLREETEWVETVDAGWNQLVGADADCIVNAWHGAREPTGQTNNFYGDGFAAEKIIDNLGFYE